MTAIITDLTLPTGIQMSGEAISGSIAFNGTTQFLSTTTSGLDTTNQTPLGGSIYFDNSNNGYVSYATQVNNALNLADGAGNWTVECWYYALSYPSVNGGALLQKGWYYGSTYSSYGFIPNGDGKMYFYVGNGGGSPYGTQVSVAFSLNTWNHFAMVRQGSYIGAYLNGTLIGFTALAFVMGDAGGDLYLSRSTSNTASTYINGYVNNVRIVKGQSVYPTVVFTPPNAPLTAVPGTSVLLNVTSPGAYLTDSSINNYTITKNGPVTYSSNPPTAIGGVLKFTSSYLTVSDNTVLDMASGDFTIEFWFNSTTGTTLYTKRSSNVNYSPVQLVWGSSIFTVYMSTSGSTWDVTASTTASYPANTWYHVALVRNSNNIYLYVNGILAITPAAITGSVMTNSSNFAIGADSASSPGSVYTGSITNFRIVKGTAVYTSNFTVPTSPLTAISGTSLLLSVASSGAYITDTSGNSLTVTNAGGVIYNSPVAANPVGTGGSLSFNGTSTSLTLNGAAMPTGTADFTIEFWTFQPSWGYGNYPRLLQGSTGSIQLYMQGHTLGVTISSIVGLCSADMNPYNNTWVHIAVTRSKNRVYLFLNGILVSISPETTYSLLSTPSVTIFQPEGGGPAGQLTNFRIVQGTAIYNSNFTPSTFPLPSTQTANIYGNPSNAITGIQTSLLLNAPIGAGFLTDSSSFNHTPTNGGTATSTSNTLFYSNSFTVELWWNPSGSGQANGKIFQTDDGDDYTAISLALDGTGNNLLVYMSSTGLSWNLVNGTSFTLTTGIWYHIALVYDGTTIKLYLNGTGTTLATVTTFISPIGTTVIGGQTNGKNAYGLISNVRLMNGVAVYTSDFASPIGPLSITQTSNQNGNPSNPTNNIASTNLMLNTVNNSSYLTDSSYFKNTITANASPTSSASNPFN